MLLRIIRTVIILSTLTIAQQSFNHALKLDGEDQYVEIPNREYLNYDAEHDFTFEIKFKADSVKPSVFLSKFDINDMGYMEHGFLIDLFKRNDQISLKFPVVFYGTYYPCFIRIIRFSNFGGTAVLDSLGWNHYSYVLSPRGDSFDMMNDRVFTLANRRTKRLESNSPLYIGGYPPADSIDGSLIFFNGRIDELRVWNRKRTKEEILTTIDDTLSGVYYNSLDSGLVAYYRFDKIETLTLSNGTTYDYAIRDLTINNNHAKIFNGASLVPYDGVTSVDSNNDLLQNFLLNQNYPNPFNPTTTIKFTIPAYTSPLTKGGTQGGVTELVVYDILGREVKTLLNKQMQPGSYEVEFNASHLASGVYFYRLKSGSFIQTKKMILIK